MSDTHTEDTKKRGRPRGPAIGNTNAVSHGMRDAIRMVQREHKVPDRYIRKSDLRRMRGYKQKVSEDLGYTSVDRMATLDQSLLDFAGYTVWAVKKLQTLAIATDDPLLYEEEIRLLIKTFREVRSDLLRVKDDSIDASPAQDLRREYESRSESTLAERSQDGPETEKGSPVFSEDDRPSQAI